MPKVTKTSPDPPSILQKLANIYNWRENLAENIDPYGYDDFGRDSLQRLYNAIILDKKEGSRREFERMDYETTSPQYSERIDLLNMLLGREQKHNTIKKSEYKPTKAKDSDVEYYKSNITEEEIKKYLLRKSYPHTPWDEFEGPEWLIEEKPYGNVLGNYTIDKGVDEKGHYVSYYDKWDLHPFSDEVRSEAEISRGLENKIQSAVGIKPAEIYGRVYYDPKTGKPIESKKDGGRIRKYQDGGDVNDLLKMLGKYKGAPEDKEVLSSLVSESTQPSGYTQPVLPVEKKIELIDKPAQITQAPDEVKKADWSTMFANPMQMLKYTGKYGMTRPTKAELDAQKSNIYDSITSMFNPSAYVEALKHMGTSVDAADQALLQGFKDGRMSPGDLSNVVGNLSDAGMQALFLSMAPMGGRTWASAIKELRRPALGARIPQEFRGSRLLGPTAETATTESSALQQLANTQEALPAAKVKAPKVKKKKYEPVSAYEESNVAVSIPELPASRELLAYVPELALSNVPSIPEPLKTLDDQIAFLEKMMGMIESRTSLIERQNQTGYKKYSDALVRAKEIKQKAIASSNPGVYQYPSFMTGSKLEGQVSPKDGTIARSALEQLVKNKNTKHSEAIAVKDVLSEFEGKRIPYENFKQSLALDIRSAEIIPTDVYANVGIAELSGSRKWKHNIIPKTNIYKDASLGLTKEGESHFKDTPHTFWIRSFPYENSLRILEWQTDIKKLKIPSKGLPASDEAADYYPRSLSGEYFDGDPDISSLTLSLNEQIKIFKNEIAKLKGNLEIAHLPLGYTQELAKMEKGLKIALDHQKEVIKGPKAAAEGLPLKFVNESLLDAARQGKKYLDVPTLETIYKIEGYEIPNQYELNASKSYVKQVIDRYNEFIPGEGYSNVGFIDDGVNELKKGYDKIRANLDEGGVNTPNWSYLFKHIELSHSGVPAKRIRDLSRQWNAIFNFQNYIDRNYIPSDTFNHNFKDGLSLFEKDGKLQFDVNTTGSTTQIIKSLKRHLPDIKKAFLKNLDDAEELTVRNAEYYKKKLKEHQDIIDRIYADGIKVSDMNESRLSTTRDYRNFPKLWSKEFGTEVIKFKDEFGNTYNRVVVPEKFFQTDPSKLLEIKTYKKGGLLNKLVKKYQDGGGIFKKLRERRADRRIEKTPVRDASSQEVLEMLSSYGADSPMMQGEYDPRKKEIVMYKDDADTLKHEQVHAAQYGPLQRLAYRMNQDRSAPIQDPTKRKVYRKLSENISPEAYAAFNRAGKLILDKGEEFEAVLDTGVNAAKEKGVNFNVSFEEILSQLKNIPSPTNNMIGLMKFMENRFTREQRDLILKSIR